MSHISTAELPLGGTARSTMQPVNVGACFGWLHVPAAGAGADTAVLLCPALGLDGLTGHRPLRLLANALAGAGYPTLRFDYPGTGDSCDPGPDADLWTGWLGSVHQAADWLRDLTGAQRLALCGLRLGATLASFAVAQRADVAALTLLAPIVRGRSFIRHMQMEAKLAGTLREGGALELNGVPLSPGTVQTITALELGQAALPPNCAVSIFSQAPSPALEACALGWTQAGTPVAQAGFAGLEPMLRPRFMSHEPPADVSRIVEWLLRAAPAAATARVAVPPATALRPAGCEEVPTRFGPGGRLFGVLCRPADREAESAVVILNSGGDPRHGFDRGAVDIARRLAVAGIASLRMDFAGLGDSVALDDGETHVFETSRHADTSAALDVLAGAGFRHLAVYGLCSGAFHAFHAAVADERIETLLLVNLPLFEWRPGEKIEFFQYAQEKPLHYAAKLQRLDIWRKLLFGQLNVRALVVAQSARSGARLAALRMRLARWAGFGPPPSFAQTAAQALSRRTRTLLIMAADDPGLFVLSSEFGPGRVPPGGTLHVLPNINHPLTRTAMRSAVAELMIKFMKNR